MVFLLGKSGDTRDVRESIIEAKCLSSAGPGARNQEEPTAREAAGLVSLVVAALIRRLRSS